MFSEVVKNALVEAGWISDRKFDIRQYENALIREGYYLPQVLKDFLTEFGGLTLKHPDFTEWTPELLQALKRIPGANLKRKSYQIMHFNVVEALGPPCKVPVKAEEIFEPRIGEDMIIFGEVYDGRLILWMTPSGKIYGQDGSFLTLLGNDYVEMLENIFHRKKTPEIP